MKKILLVLSEWGYWGEELIGPLEACDAAGYDITFLTPTGKKPTPLSVSCSPGYIDPPLGRSVTSEEMAEKTRQVNESNRLDGHALQKRGIGSDVIPSPSTIG